MRQGELRALKWEDVELDRGLLRVRHTMTRENGHYSVGETKTKGSRGTIRLSKDVIRALREHHKNQLEHKMKYRGLGELAGRP